MSNNTLKEEEQILLLRYNQKNGTILCPKCNIEILYDDSYCYNCGIKLDECKKEEIVSSIINKELLFKYASVAIIKEIQDNPLLFNQIHCLDNFIQHFKPLTTYELHEYIINEEFVKVLEGKEKYDSYLNSCSEKDIQKILYEENLGYGNSREENKSIIFNNLSDEKLEDYCPFCYELTAKSEELLKENYHCIVYYEIFYDFDLNYYDTIFCKCNDVWDCSFELLENSISDSIKELKWQSYSDLLFKYSQIYGALDNDEKMIYYMLQHFICEINPFGDNLIKSKIEFKQSMKDKLIQVLSVTRIDYNKFNKILDNSCENVKIPKNFIPKDEIKFLIEEVLCENFRLVNNHLISIYGKEYFDLESMEFNNRIEEEKVIKLLEKNIN